MSGARYVFVEPIELRRVLLDSRPAFRLLVPKSGKPVTSRTFEMRHSNEFHDGRDVGGNFDTIRHALPDLVSSKFCLQDI